MHGKVSTITTFNAATGGSIVNQVKYTYDGWGDLKTEQSHAGAVVSGTTPAVTYSYEDGADANGNALFVRPENGTGFDEPDSATLTAGGEVCNVRMCHVSGVMLLEDSSTT